MALKGNIESLRALRRAVERLQIIAAQRIAAASAPEISGLAGDAYDSGQTVYGSPRPRGADGAKLSLVKSGASRRAMRFIATGRDIRTAILPRWTRYLIGKYDVLPNGPLPQLWRERLTSIARSVIDSELPK